MKKRIALGVVAVCLLLAGGPMARAASTTNFSDQYYIQTESGWGAAVLQIGSVLFIDLFVYGQDGKATWFVAAAAFQGSTAQGHLIFSGDLYAATGPYFGGAFDPNAVNGRKVGTLTFEADSVETATITYSVDGVTVVKNTVRQTWAADDITGNYYGGLILDWANCNPSYLNGHDEELGTVQITHSANGALKIVFPLVNIGGGATCTFNGTYGQTGHMGSASGTYSCSNGVNGTLQTFEMEKTISGLTGRLAGQNQYCTFTGRLGGLLR
jgi:hypothetical protein